MKTPYDKEIARLEAADPNAYTREQWQWAHGLAEGYRKAKEEDEALLKIAQTIMTRLQSLRWCPLCHLEECGCWDELATAIAKAGGAA